MPKVMRSIVNHVDASDDDDAVTSEMLRALGNAATTMLPAENGMQGNVYVPRRVLIRTAKRLQLGQDEVHNMFPDHGYHDGADFLVQLQGVNRFYKEVRSLAGKQQPHDVARRLAMGKMWRGPVHARTPTPTRRHGRNTRESKQQDQDESLFERGISDKALTAEALDAIAHHDASYNSPFEQLMCGCSCCNYK